MPADVGTLVKVIDVAISHGAEQAIKDHGQSLSQEEADAIRKLSEEQLRQTLKNLLAANEPLGFFDDNNNNNK